MARAPPAPIRVAGQIERTAPPHPKSAMKAAQTRAAAAIMAASTGGVSGGEGGRLCKIGSVQKLPKR
jgi:hypothetical protein